MMLLCAFRRWMAKRPSPRHSACAEGWHGPDASAGGPSNRVVDVGTRGIGGGDREFQCVNADVIELEILQIFLDTERIVRSFEGDFTTVDRRIGQDRAVLFA